MAGGTVVPIGCGRCAVHSSGHVAYVMMVGQFPAIGSERSVSSGRGRMDERRGRALQARFYHLQRTCHYGASSTSDTGKGKKRKK